MRIQFNTDCDKVERSKKVKCQHKLRFLYKYITKNLLCQPIVSDLKYTSLHSMKRTTKPTKFIIHRHKMHSTDSISSYLLIICQHNKTYWFYQSLQISHLSAKNAP